MAKPSKISKFFRNLLTVLLVVIILCTLGLNLLFQNDNSAPFIFGNGFYIMRQVNILDVSYGDVVISNKNKISEIQPGNVVLCLTSYDDFKEVLRVQEIVQEDGVTYYMVRSDDVDDQPRKLSADKIIAKCTYTNSILGSVIGFVKSWQGIAVLVGGSGIILVLMYLTSYSAKHEEELREEREEEERQRAKKKATNNAKAKQQKSHTESVPVKKPEISTNSTKKDHNNIAVKTPITVKTIIISASVKPFLENFLLKKVISKIFLG